MAGVPIPQMIYPFTDYRYRTITQNYGPTLNAFEPLLGGVHFHRGTDFAVPGSTPLLAAAAGTVTWAAPDKYGYLFNGGYGNMVGIDHGGNVCTLYGHMASIMV